MAGQKNVQHDRSTSSHFHDDVAKNSMPNGQHVPNLYGRGGLADAGFQVSLQNGPMEAPKSTPSPRRNLTGMSLKNIMWQLEDHFSSKEDCLQLSFQMC